MEEASRWVPIESNPLVISEYLKALGFPIGPYRVIDVVACESWALEMIPGVVCAFLLLYPITPRSEAERATQQVSPNPAVYHMKQFISNACGTIGLIHMAANLRTNDVLACPVALHGFFERFLDVTQNMSSHERGQELVHNAELFEEIKKAHHDAATQGQTRPRDRVNTHFIAIVPKAGCIYELDGRKEGPISHGNYSSPESFGWEALQVIQREFIMKDPTQVEFAILGLYFSLE